MGKTPVQVPPDLMSYQEAADALGLTPGSLRTAVSEGRLHSVKVPGIQSKFVRRAEVAAYRQVSRTTEEAPVMSTEQLQAFAQALAAPMESLARNTAREAAQAATQAAVREAVPGVIAMVLGGLQIQRGQAPTLDPKALAV